jgi:capsular polysaccharide biosynthesis protein
LHFRLETSTKPEQLIYVSRQGASQRRYVNEDTLINTLAKIGIKSHRLEEYSLIDQIKLFRVAKLVIARHGAGLTNLLFSSHASVLEHFSDTPLNHYRLLCKAKNLKYANLVGPEDHKNSNINAPVEEIVSKAERLLQP